MHPSLVLPVPVVNHHNANPASAASTKSSSTGTISPLITTNSLSTPSVSDVAEDGSTRPAPLGVRIRKTGLKRTHACDQCPQCE
jgi:hypothetical protein